MYHRQLSNQQILHRSLIIVIILATVWLRLWQLPTVPPGLEYDEAYNGLDALWMLEQGQLYVFVQSNHGREALYLYPAALFIQLLGSTPLALRLTSALAGILAVPLLYRLALEMFRAAPHRRWLALLAAAGLAVSLWHVSMSRVAFRSIFIPAFFAWWALLFWRGWRKNSWRYFIGAGLVLGLSQYAYLSARLFPLALLLFGVAVWIGYKFGRLPLEYSTTVLLKGLLATGLVSLVSVAPLAIFFWQQPAAFAGRADQVLFQIEANAAGLAELGQHVGAALSIFAGGADPRIRHHLVEWPVLSVITLAGFWFGLTTIVWRWRQPAHLFLLISLGVMILPGLLSVDPIHNLRTSGILPTVYLIAAVGWTQLLLVWPQFWLPAWSNLAAGLGALGVVLLVGGALTGYLYFGVWANDPHVYAEYNASALELANYAAKLARSSEVIVPYEFYAYPPVRYVLQESFPETLPPPIAPTERPANDRPVFFLNQPEWDSPPFIWLSWDDQAGAGAAYLEDSPTAFDESGAESVSGSRGSPIAHRLAITGSALALIEDEEEIVSTPFMWGRQDHLAGFALASPLVQAGQAGRVTLYWDDLEESDLSYKTFIQILDWQGNPISQIEENVVYHPRLYYENRDGFVRRQHLFWTGAETSPGLYLLRAGLFNPKTGHRMEINTVTGDFVGDQLILTPFYVVTETEPDPRQPDRLLKASLGDTIQLLGYSLGDTTGAAVKLKLYWQATEPVELDYTATVQLLDKQQQVLAQQDKQPLAGLYPTSRWQPGQIIMDEFLLPVSSNTLPAGGQLATGLYDLSTGIRLPARTAAGEQYLNDLIVLEH